MFKIELVSLGGLPYYEHIALSAGLFCYKQTNRAWRKIALILVRLDKRQDHNVKNK